MRVIVNVIVKKDDKILMVQEGSGNDKGMWNFPAGHLDEGENIFDAAIREAKEETGFDVKLTGFVHLQNLLFENKHVMQVIFTAEIVGGEIVINPEEIMNVEFLDIDKVLNMSDNELRGRKARVESIQKFLKGDILPLSAVSNVEFKTK